MPRMHILSAVEQDRFEQPPKHSTALLEIIETHSPQSWASFNIFGEFDFSDEKLQDTTGVLPPQKKAGQIIPENWGLPNRSPVPP